MIHNYMTKFPHIMVNQIFMACLTNGHWVISTIQEEANMVGQNLTILTFMPIRTGMAEYKHQQEETNAILSEDLVGTASSQCTKGSLQLYNGGSILYQGHLLSNMLAKYILILEAANAPLGIYLSPPPSTWVSPKANKEPPKKSQKTTNTSSPGAKPPKANPAPPMTMGTGGSKPNYGMLLVLDNIHHRSQLLSGKHLCLLFSTKGKSCTKGYQCTNHHATRHPQKHLPFGSPDH
jgi:hypothetical protein